MRTKGGIEVDRVDDENAGKTTVQTFKYSNCGLQRKGPDVDLGVHVKFLELVHEFPLPRCELLRDGHL